MDRATVNQFHCLASGRGGLSARWTKVAENCMKWDRYSVTIFTIWPLGGGPFWQVWQSCWKLHEMDRSNLKTFHYLATGEMSFSSRWNKVAGKLHEMDRSSLNFFHCLFTGGGLFSQLNQRWYKLHEMYRSSLKIFHCLAAGGGGGGLFCQLNQIWYKLHEMDTSSPKNFTV